MTGLPFKRAALIALLLIFTALLPLAAGCHPGGEPAYAEPADYVDSRLVEANTDFAFDLFHTLLRGAPGYVLFVSPASVSLALAMMLALKASNISGITELIEPPIDPLTVLFLSNAIYFKAAWAEPFDPDQTREIPFNLPDGSSKEHQVMFREGQFRCLEQDGFQAVSIPYGKTKRISIYVFLPASGQNLESFYEQLTPEAWDSWMDLFLETEAYIGLPRFKFEYEASLNDALKAMGMEIAFNDSAADFSKMKPVPPRMFIAEVKHKTFVEVNEKGTEAAAATSVEIREESAPAFCMIVDRPFFFSIVDNKTGSILFMGSVTDPLQ